MAKRPGGTGNVDTLNFSLVGRHVNKISAIVFYEKKCEKEAKKILDTPAANSPF